MTLLSCIQDKSDNPKELNLNQINTLIKVAFLLEALSTVTLQIPYRKGTKSQNPCCQNHQARPFQLKKDKISKKKQEPTSIQQKPTPNFKMKRKYETPTNTKKYKSGSTLEGSFESQALQIRHPW